MAGEMRDAGHPQTASVFPKLQEMAKMQIIKKVYSRAARRVCLMVGAAATAGIAPVGGQVFAHQFLQEAQPVADPDMIYEPAQQLMVSPVTGLPIFTYSKSLRDAAQDDLRTAASDQAESGGSSNSSAGTSNSNAGGSSNSSAGGASSADPLVIHVKPPPPPPTCTGSQSASYCAGDTD